MLNLLSQSHGPDFDWSFLIYVGLAALGGLSSVITKVFGKKDDTVDAEIDDGPAARPQPQRPIARAPQPVQRPTTAHPTLHQPTAPPARPQPARPAPRAPVSRPPQQPQVRTPGTTRPAPRPQRQVVRPQPHYVEQPPLDAIIDAIEDRASAIPETIESPSLTRTPMQLDLDTAGLRRAIILKEILSPPVALRDGSDDTLGSKF
ncbi:MAG: hypothetical protein H6817_03140 [Phycisphaerales bacterium]|nr:hypothetical protein [Phycisphaerales bacterium]